MTNPTDGTDPGVLRGRHVHLEPLALEHVDGLVTAATEDRSSYRWTTVPATAAAMRQHVDELLTDAGRGLVVPFVQRSLATGALVGATRYLDLHRWRQHTRLDAVEIGGTWLAASAQRTAINTEAKLLLLTNAFERWQVARVAICTDARNSRSRAAIERLGARFEGILRNYRRAAGPDAGTGDELRDTALYAVVAADWPEVRQRLTGRLDAGDATTDTRA